MATDTSGNQAVDFVWGNMPLQPNTGRGTNLDPALDNHNVAASGWSGYPGQVNGTTIPNIVGLTIADATTALTARGLVLGTQTGTGATVLTQSIVAGTWAAPGTAVNITK